MSNDFSPEQINSKTNLQMHLSGMDQSQLEELAKQIRARIIRVVSENGGHLASNLGVVELSIALHRSFNSPQDKLIWDVGHQSYVHKILTGRNSLFPTLRRFRGLSGFPKKGESQHDIYETGHSSTSISAALGLAIARDILHQDHHVVAIIGDGALSGGMSFEALNHAGNSGTKLIIILNDNEMSISPNVGGLALYLNRLRNQPGYFRTKNEVKSILSRLPSGDDAIDFIHRLKMSAKSFVLPGLYFEDLGLNYLGPVDGHNLEALDLILEQAKLAPGPVVVHIRTQKGKGFSPAEDHPEQFHGVAAFDRKTGEPLKTPTSNFTKVFSSAIIAEAEADERIVAISAAMPDGTGLSDFAKRYPKRFFDVGIAEEHAVTLAAGLATAGLKPIVAVYSTFMQRAVDQIIEDVALQKLPVTFILDRAGLVGEDGETHHGMFDLSYLRFIPNLTILAPKDYSELQASLRLAISMNGPIALRYPRGSGEAGIPLANPEQMLQSEVMKEGVTNWIIAVGPFVYIAQRISKRLEEEGILLGVINLRSVKPLDSHTLKPLLSRTRNLITLEENVLAGGAGSAILELCSKEGFMPKSLCLGLPDHFIEHGSRQELLNMLSLDEDQLLVQIREFLQEKIKEKANVWSE